MAYIHRSLTGDLNEGMTDGRYRKTAPNRHTTEDTYKANREGLNPDWNYDHILQEMPNKTLPDASAVIKIKDNGQR